jgi:hypothetical protein
LNLRNSIRRSHKILFAENDDEALFNFLRQGPTGLLLASHIKRNNIISGFIGEDSRYAGKKMVTNHLSNLYNAYYGRLHYQDGLGLLRTSIIMSNTYDANSSDFYENTTAAIPYSMIKDSLEYGIYLERNSYLKFSQQSGSNYFTASGSLSTIVVTNHGTLADFASQPVNNSGDVRNYVGFTKMKYTLLNGPTSMKVGIPHPTDDVPYEFENVTEVFSVANDIATPFPNPSKTGVFCLPKNKSEQIVGYSVSDITGRIIQKVEKNQMSDSLIVDLSEFSNGAYILTWFTTARRFTTLLIKG